jgi:hypothetical protein
MLHTHHILPKYLGGTDDPSNLVELTIEDHAEAHRLLYEQHGNLQDFCAWKGLAGILSKQEIIEILCSEGGKIGGSAGGKKAAEIHRRNKTGLFREDKEVQRLGNIAGAALGGSSGAKNQIENRIGIFGYSEEEKTKVCALGGSVAGKISGANHRDNKTGIFNEDRRKHYSSLGGKAQKGFKKHYHANGDFKMALPGSEKSQKLIEQGYVLK